MRSVHITLSVTLNIRGDLHIDGTMLVKRITYQQGVVWCGVVWSHLDEDRIQ